MAFGNEPKNTDSSERELNTSLRKLKELKNTLAEFSNETEGTRKALGQTLDILKETKNSINSAFINEKIIHEKKMQQVREMHEILGRQGYIEKERNILIKGMLRDSIIDAREGAKTFQEFSKRIKEAKLDVKEIGNLTANFFRLAVKGAIASSFVVAKAAYNADVYSKKASLILGGPKMGFGGEIFTPSSGIRNEIPGFILSMAAMGKTIDESIGILKKWNFSVRKEGAEFGSTQNAKYVIGAAKVSTAMASLAQVSEGTADTLTETLMQRLGLTGEEVGRTFQNLISLNKDGALTNEQYISSVTEMIEKNMRYNRNMDFAAPIMKNFSESIRHGIFSLGEINTLFTTMAEMPAEQSAGLAMLIRQAGGKLPPMFEKAGSDPYALAGAAFFSGSNADAVSGLMKMLEKMAYGQGHRDEGIGIEGRLGLLTSMSVMAKYFGYNLDPRKIETLRNLEKSGKLSGMSEEQLKKEMGTKDPLLEVAEKVGEQTKTTGDLFRLMETVITGGAMTVMDIAERKASTLQPIQGFTPVYEDLERLRGVPISERTSRQAAGRAIAEKVNIEGDLGKSLHSATGGDPNKFLNIVLEIDGEKLNTVIKKIRRRDNNLGKK